MLATLERPLERPTNTPATVGRLTLVGPPPEECVPALLPVLPAASDSQVRALRSSALAGPPAEQARPQLVPASRSREGSHSAHPAKLRITVRARRLLAALAFLCAVGVGLVVVDVVSALVPDAPAPAYAAQFAPYEGSAGDSAAADGLVPASGSSIVVAPGDTLWSVAQRVGPDADPRSVIAAIMTMNGLDSPSIQAGQVLRLP